MNTSYPIANIFMVVQCTNSSTVKLRHKRFSYRLLNEREIRPQFSLIALISYTMNSSTSLSLKIRMVLLVSSTYLALENQVVLTRPPL